MKIISFDGSIASGKSTLLQLIKDEFKDDVIIIQNTTVFSLPTPYIV
jgi:uridine kinase